MALTGYREEEVIASLNSLSSAYEEIMSVIGDRMQNEFVNAMADKWACPNAQKFFNEFFKQDIDNLILGVNNIYGSVFNSVNDAAAKWASETGNVWPGMAFSEITKKIDTSCILENISGVRGIDLEQASEVASRLTLLAADAENGVSKASNAVDNSGFIGGDQASSLKSSLEQIRTNISSAVNNITTNAKSSIEETVSMYGDTAGQISQAFAGE